MKEAITYSELRARRRCPYQAHLSYDLRLAPRMLKAGLREGTIADKGMDALYLHVRDAGDYSYTVMAEAMNQTWRDEQTRIMAAEIKPSDVEWQEMEDRQALLLAVAAEYVAYAKQHDPFERIVTMQLAGRVPVLSPSGRASTKYDYLFKADGLVVIDGRLWLLENKWWKSIEQNVVRMLVQDEQCGMYLWGLSQMIERGTAPADVLTAVAEYGPPVGVYYNVIRKKLPVVPQQNKDGKTSQAANIDTTHDVYLAAIMERNQDPADYATILDALAEKGDTFHYREGIYRNATELREIGERIHVGTQVRAQRYTFKFPLSDCVWSCMYRPLCVEWSDEVVAFHYRVKERAHEEYGTEEIAA
ncbi:MAG: PD-(D/E)XK nuclease family protein [Thioalkalivibrio sp.]|nr:PD-(D/E)XK nuclease family protein [Thioalkalivibrio sp.]